MSSAAVGIFNGYNSLSGNNLSLAQSLVLATQNRLIEKAATDAGDTLAYEAVERARANSLNQGSGVLQGFFDLQPYLNSSTVSGVLLAGQSVNSDSAVALAASPLSSGILAEANAAYAQAYALLYGGSVSTRLSA